MNKFHVLLTNRAEADVAAALAWFRKRSAHAAGAKWFAQVMAVIDKLESMPDRCPKAAEAEDIGMDIREILVGKRQNVYRVLFRIEDRTVHILRVWNASKDAIAKDDLI